jgi:D-methionine transport system substrate-binding protein
MRSQQLARPSATTASHLDACDAECLEFYGLSSTRAAQYDLRVFGDTRFLSRRSIFDGTGITIDDIVDQSNKLLIGKRDHFVAGYMWTGAMLGKIISATLTVLVGLSLTNASAEPQVLRVGVSAGPYAEVLRFAAEQAAKQELDVKVIEFTDWTLPNAALNQGDLDLNNFQHQPYLDNQVAQRGYDLVPIAKSIVVPTGLYSKRITSLDQIKDGATVAIPNDPANGARGLQLLEKAGLIKLKPDVGIKSTQLDIVDNPKHLKIKELDAAQLPRALDDVDFAVVSLNYAVNAGLDPKKALLLEGADTNWNLVFVTRTKDKDNPTIWRFVDIYRSAEVKDFIQKRFGGTILATW